MNAEQQFTVSLVAAIVIIACVVGVVLSVGGVALSVKIATDWGWLP